MITDPLEEKTQYDKECAEGKSRLNVGVVNLLKHRRFIYKSLVVPRVGIVHDGAELYLMLDGALGKDWVTKFKSPIDAFEATFRHGSIFIEWIDDEWMETKVPNVKLRDAGLGNERITEI